MRGNAASNATGTATTRVIGDVVGEAALAAFRAHWTGDRLLGLLGDAGSVVLVGWAVGVGKSVAIDNVVEAAARSGRYDLTVVLLPTRAVLAERRWVQAPPPGGGVVVLRPRPRPRCGPLDADWAHFERHGLGGLGRRRLCAACPERPGCPWPGQYGPALRSARVVFGTQAHLGRDPRFVDELARRTGARRPLVLLDEDTAAAAPAAREIRPDELAAFAAAARALASTSPRLARWAYLAETLQGAATADLRSPEWHFPRLPHRLAVALQEAGWDRWGRAFRFLGYDLPAFGRSPRASRERTAGGAIRFAAPPAVGPDTLVFSATAHPELLAHRLGRPVAAPFAGVRFAHPGTAWYNLASRIGMRAYWPNNAEQILDFAAGLVARRLAEGRRPLLLAKKCFLGRCARGLERRLAELGVAVRVVTGDWDAVDLAAPGVVPLAHFGLIGTNRFEHCDGVYCLSGYYVPAGVLEETLGDLLASDARVPVAIATAGRPPRRRAAVRRPADRFTDVNRLADLALGQKELDVVIQAVGRVRPHTRPREILTFQCGAHRAIEYTREFHSLAEARAHFGVPTRRERERDALFARVQAAKGAGRSQRQAAAELGVGLATVKRYWHRPPGGGAAGPPPVLGEGA